MKYITVREAAQKWNISERLTQQYCTAGRVQGANKFGGAWAIPEDAPKPEDPRKVRGRTGEAQKSSAPAAEASYVPMPLMNTPFVPGHCLEAVDAIGDPKLRKIALAEYHYFSGRAEEAAQEAELFLTSPDLSLRLSACLIYAYANLATDHIHRARFALAELENTLKTMDDSTPYPLRALASCVAKAAAVLLHLPVSGALQNVDSAIRLLPPGLQFFALYVRAHQAYLEEDYKGSIGMVETALALQPAVYPIANIYLHMVATMDYMSLKKPQEAKRHLLSAWELAQPDDLIEAFGEHHGLLGGMLEAVIKKDWPEDFKRIINITYRFSAGWRKIHNPDTGHDVADNLTTTEFAAAMLAARDWTNQEIGDHMGISPNTVKRYISTALQKLNVSQRKELKQFMLK